VEVAGLFLVLAARAMEAVGLAGPRVVLTLDALLAVRSSVGDAVIMLTLAEVEFANRACSALHGFHLCVSAARTLGAPLRVVQGAELSGGAAHALQG